MPEIRETTILISDRSDHDWYVDRPKRARWPLTTDLWPHSEIYGEIIDNVKSYVSIDEHVIGMWVQRDTTTLQLTDALSQRLDAFVGERAGCTRESVANEALRSWLDANDGTAEQRFQDLARRWHSETAGLSSTSAITSNPSYLEMIGLGPAALPWMLRDLRDRGGNWYVALEALTLESPVRAEDNGFPRKMKEAWLAWGRRRGYTL